MLMRQDTTHRKKRCRHGPSLRDAREGANTCHMRNKLQEIHLQRRERTFPLRSFSHHALINRGTLEYSVDPSYRWMFVHVLSNGGGTVVIPLEQPE